MNGRRVVREPCQSKTYSWGETEWQAREERGKMTQVTEENSENDWEEKEMPGCLCLLWLVLMALGQLGWWADESETVCWGEKKPKKASFSIVTSEQKKKSVYSSSKGSLNHDKGGHWNMHHQRAGRSYTRWACRTGKKRQIKWPEERWVRDWMKEN